MKKKTENREEAMNVRTVHTHSFTTSHRYINVCTYNPMICPQNVKWTNKK